MLHYNKKLIFIILGFIGVVIITTVAYILLLRNPLGGEMHIENLSTYTNGKPTDAKTLETIRHALYTAIRNNYAGNLPDNSIKDILIRNGSFQQTHDQAKDIHTVNFIVDIKSLQQSYLVEYTWSQKTNLDEDAQYQYGTTVSCLPTDQLIYGYFGCNYDF